MAIPTRGPELLGVNITFIIIASCAFLLRCFVRLKMVKAFGRDDWLMGFALLFFLFYNISSNIGVKYGTGRHHHDLTDVQIETARQCWFFCYLFYAWSMICSKFSIAFLLLRISFKRVHTWIIYTALFVSVFAGLTFFFVIIFQCQPVSHFWQRTRSGTCVPNDVIVGLGFTYSLFSIITDFTFAILPGFLVWNLQLKRKAKFALIPLITMGCVASAAVIARLPYIRLFNSPDFLWATTDIAIWSTVEQGLAITAGSLATLRPLFFLVLNRLGFSTQPTGRRPSNYGGMSGQRLGGSVQNSKADKLRSDSYKLSSMAESRPSHDEGHREKDFFQSPNWFSNAYSPAPPPKAKAPKESRKLTKKSATTDNDSEKNLKLKGSASRSSDDLHDGIMVSKSFHITGEEPTTARNGPLA